MNDFVEGGFPGHKCRHIANGFDTRLFRPDPSVRERTRQSLGVGKQEVLVGYLSRIHPSKGLDTLLASATRVAASAADCRFLVVGNAVDQWGKELLGSKAALALGDKLLHRPETFDIQDIYPALDLLVHPSHTDEGMPNVVAEAMASGIPVVATDVGDVADIVGDTGLVTPPTRPIDLAVAILETASKLPECREDMAVRARRRIEMGYTVEAMIGKSKELILDVANDS